MVSRTETLLACVHELAPRHVIGTDPFDVERLAWNIQRSRLQPAGRGVAVGAGGVRHRLLGPDGAVARRAGLEAARRQVPRARAGVRQRLVPGRARSRRDRPAGADSRRARLPGAEARSVRRRISRAIAGRRAPRDVEIVAAVRDAVGPDVQIMVEMHGRFTPSTAVRWRRLLEPFKPEWIEEPVPPENPEATRRVRQATRACRSRPASARTRWRISAPFIEQGLVDIVQVDMTHFGGFLPMKRLAGWADAYDLLLAPHNVCGPVGTMANLHLRGRDAELQGARALQRLRRQLGSHRSSTIRRPSKPTAVSRCPIGRAWGFR